MTSYRSSNEESLISRLERRGVPLDAHWGDVLPDVSTRLWSVLTRHKFFSLRDVVRGFSRGEEWMLGLKNFDRTSYEELKQALEELAVGSLPLLPGDNLSDRLEARLEQQGVPLDQPWEEVLLLLPIRAQRALTLSACISLRDVVREIEAGSPELLNLPNCGSRSIRAIRKALDTIATTGLGVYLYGSAGSPPADFEELKQRVLESLSHEERRLIVGRIFEGLTLEELGEEYGLTRERIRQKLQEVLKPLGVRFGAAARELTAPVVAAAAGGLIHRDEVESLVEESDLNRVLLGLLVAGQNKFRIWRDDYLERVL